MPDASAPFRFHHPVAIRFRDIDVGGHAHHSLALIYMEEARWAYWKEVAGREGIDEVDYILAEATVRYHRRILYPGDAVVGVRTASVGRKHFEMSYEIRDARGARMASGSTVQVMYDYAGGRSERVPDELRACLEAFEGRELPARRT